eukprot:CAMPEP_0172896768 /NCGR_PEP_ID=MMETSP1075-20121228/156159_1 /TAXON_ID=2916 /ORGANISM="Ceratium fusus, Strain PA161109" /LENGTH=212 /DNA_ID=CAMNT_0013752225 /DNA_START=239 /DNA_END=877 /DNA_ORIENTATION=-
MPKVALANILEAQASILDVQQRMVEVQQMCDARRKCLSVRPAQEGRANEKDGTARSGHSEQLLQHWSGDLLDNICRGRCCTVTSTGKAVPMPRAAARHGLRPRATHPMMDAVDKHRLDNELRQQVVYDIFCESVERWWVRYENYKAEKVRFRHGWDDWRASVAALGPGQRAAWPSFPPIPRYPYEITTVDMQQLRKTVHSLLKPTGEVAAQA